MRMSPLVAYIMIVGPVAAAWPSGVAAQTDTSGAPRVFPYGHSQAVVTCAPLRACVIELQAGERVVATALGDSERWVAEEVVAGGAPVVIVRPVACDIATNVVVATDRRVYDVGLDSPVCTHGAMRYTHRIRFSYPDSLVVRPSALTSGFAPESLSFAYRWASDRHVGWSPVAVFDDGAHVYVKLPESARHADLPVLLLENDDRSTAVLNYVLTNDTYVTDRVFTRAILRDRARQVEIVNTKLFVGK